METWRNPFSHKSARKVRDPRQRDEKERERERTRTTWLHSKRGITAAESVGYGDEVIPSSFPQEMTSHLDVINTNISGSCALFRRRQNNVGRHDRIAYTSEEEIWRGCRRYSLGASTNKLATTFAFHRLPRGIRRSMSPSRSALLTIEYNV